MFGRQRRTGEIGLDAAASSAIAVRRRLVFRICPRQWIVAPFAGDRVRRRRAAAPRTTRPAPVPVPRMTPNTTSAPAAAPSAASDIAKQFASLAMRTGRPSTDVRSSRSGRPISQTELAFLTRPVDGEMRARYPDTDSSASHQHASRARRTSRDNGVERGLDSRREASARGAARPRACRPTAIPSILVPPRSMPIR